MQNRLESLSVPGYLQFLELKYGGWTLNVEPTISNKDIGRPIPSGTHQGGNKFNIFHYNNYSMYYSKYLEPLRHSKKTIHLLEVGILKGTSLAVWDEFF